MASKNEPPSPLVLVVENDYFVASDLEAMLTARGWRVLGPAATVEEALELLDQQLPDVALLDVRLFGNLVTPVAEALRRQDIPFVLSTVCAPSTIVGGTVLAGVPNIGKPVTERALIAGLTQAMRRNS